MIFLIKNISQLTQANDSIQAALRVLKMLCEGSGVSGGGRQTSPRHCIVPPDPHSTTTHFFPFADFRILEDSSLGLLSYINIFYIKSYCWIMMMRWQKYFVPVLYLHHDDVIILI